jgi:uncharacterized protein YdhG (YjbR/CyaY superfamily)
MTRKKTKTGKRTPASKGERAPKNVDEYVAGVPVIARNNFDKLRAAIQSVVPAEATETISYGIPAIKHKKILVWFAAFSGHCSLFPSAAVIEEFKDELKGFTISKGTVQFPINKPLPIVLVKKLVKARVAHAESKKQS